MKNDDEKKFNFFIGIMISILTITCLLIIINHYNLIPNLLSIVLIIITVTVLATISMYIYSKKVIKRIDSLAKKEKIKEISNYYRDKLRNYSPGILMYCFFDKINFKDYLVATIINLEHNNYITIDNDRIIVLNKENTNLSKDEQYIIKCLKDGHFKEIIGNKKTRKTILNLIFDDITNNKLYIESHIYKIFNTAVGISILLMFIYYMSSLISTNSKNFLTGMPIIIFTVSIVIIYAKFQKEINLFTKRKLYLKSSTCIDLCVKMQSLKNFLNDFTDLGNKSIKEVKIWDEYLIYSIVLNIKGNINKEVDKLYNIITND